LKSGRAGTRSRRARAPALVDERRDLAWNNRPFGSSEASLPASENAWMRSYWRPVTSDGSVRRGFGRVARDSRRIAGSPAVSENLPIGPTLGRVPTIRPMTEDDAEAALRLTIETFDDLSRRRNEEPEPPVSMEHALPRYRNFPRHDPGGSWVAEDEHGLAGCALAVKHGGVWGLSLLVVRPGLQSGGIGSDLLRHAHDYAHDATGRIILSSPDARAVRAYARLGLDLHPCFLAKGAPRSIRAPDGFREGTVDDIPFVEEVDRFARGGARRPSIETLLEMRQTLLVLPGRGYAFFGEGALRTLGALDDESAAEVLRGALARVEGEIAVGYLTVAQQWALPVLLEAGLDVSGANGVAFLAGDLGGFRPYLPSGAFR
jgi:GNAT superfamily N-acetyltransferase